MYISADVVYCVAYVLQICNKTCQCAKNSEISTL